MVEIFDILSWDQILAWLDLPVQPSKRHSFLWYLLTRQLVYYDINSCVCVIVSYRICIYVNCSLIPLVKRKKKVLIVILSGWIKLSYPTKQSLHTRSSTRSITGPKPIRGSYTKLCLVNLNTLICLGICPAKALKHNINWSALRHVLHHYRILKPCQHLVLRPLLVQLI